MNPYQKYNPYQSNLDWIMVQTIDQVDSIAVQPNHKAWIMVQNEPIFALRTADAMGLTNTELYKFEKYERPKASYVTNEELAQAFQKLKEELNESIISATEGSKSSKRKSDATID